MKNRRSKARFFKGKAKRLERPMNCHDATMDAMNPPTQNATLYFFVQYFGLDIISTLLLYKPFWLKMFEYVYIWGTAMW